MTDPTPSSDDAYDADYTAFGTLKVERPIPLPDVVDILVAGGGPAGTAAALRAAELGLTSLVIDYDDLMKRIRDYPKEKLIKPSYGGGDKLPFPPGGPLLSSLRFDDIDKDEMVVQWKQRYRQSALAARIGSELTGLQRNDSGVWTVKTWNHRAGKDMEYRARNVLVAIGAGVPRRFDIPGNTDGVAFRLDKATRYVGAPALVIGGGTSAAEAVIAISNAKVAARDETAVYWSYRGDKLPKVSRALSEEFFDAYVGNGNVRYLAFSEPAAVVVGPDQQEYLSVRIDRKVIEGRPIETVHLEFPKEQVVACIGEDVPFKLLQSVGIKIPLVNNRPLVLVNHEGETSLEGVFVVGDVRGPRYLRCKDFNDSSTYEQVTLKRNIKAAMWDAVQAVEVIAVRAGKIDAKVATGVAPELESRRPTPEAIVPPHPSEPMDVPERRTQLASLLPDGTLEEQFPIAKNAVTIGRTGTDIDAAEDVDMAEHQATLVCRSGQYFLEDTGQGSGVWIRVQGVAGRPLEEGYLIWIGSQILMATKHEGRWAVAHYDNDGVYQGVHGIGDRGVFIGRASEVALDESDKSLSRRHAQFRIDPQGLKVFDLASTNGTYVKITAPVPLVNGDEFRVGSKRFRFETFEPVSKLSSADVVVDAPVEQSSRDSRAAGAAVTESIPQGLAPVAIEHPQHPVSFGIAPGQDLLHGYFDYLKSRYPDCKLTKTGEPAEHLDEPLGWECKVGLCGLCAVEVLGGADNFEPVDPGSPELNTLENKVFVDPDPQRYRLACLAKAKGAVKLTIPQ